MHVAKLLCICKNTTISTFKLSLHASEFQEDYYDGSFEEADRLLKLLEIYLPKLPDAITTIDLEVRDFALYGAPILTIPSKDILPTDEGKIKWSKALRNTKFKHLYNVIISCVLKILFLIFF